MNEDLEKQLKRTLRRGTKNYAKSQGRGSAHQRAPLEPKHRPGTDWSDMKHEKDGRNHE